MSKPGYNLIPIIAAIVGVILGIVLARYIGASLWIVVILLVISYLFVTKVLKIEDKNLKWAGIIQVGHFTWVFLGYAILLVQSIVPVLDVFLVFVFGAGLIWLFVKRDKKAPAVFLIVYQLFMLLFIFYNIFYIGFRSAVGAPLLLHIALRISAIVFLYKHMSEEIAE